MWIPRNFVFVHRDALKSIALPNPASGRKLIAMTWKIKLISFVVALIKTDYAVYWISRTPNPITEI